MRWGSQFIFFRSKHSYSADLILFRVLLYMWDYTEHGWNFNLKIISKQSVVNLSSRYLLKAELLKTGTHKLNKHQIQNSVDQAHLNAWSPALNHLLYLQSEYYVKRNTNKPKHTQIFPCGSCAIGNHPWLQGEAKCFRCKHI